jgi:hypothetical protein
MRTKHERERERESKRQTQTDRAREQERKKAREKGLLRLPCNETDAEQETTSERIKNNGFTFDTEIQMWLL